MSDKKGIIYIPDISGFTKFVSSTEIEHSRHIIRELLEVILDSNIIDLIPSEIEGDAILFYKLGAPPKLNSIMEQTENIFINFHKYLRSIERNNICRCGACLRVGDLTLKFVVHYGEIQEYKVKQFTNIIGKDVILVHRMLKNSLSLKEYILFTDKYLSTQDSEAIKEYCPHIEEYENFGEVKLSYVSLKDLRNKLSKMPVEEEKIPDNFIPLINITINKNLLFVYQNLIDNEKKLKWIPGIKEIIQKSNINRINHKHTCIFEDGSLELNTVNNASDNERMFFAEEGLSASGIYFRNEFLLVREGNSTLLQYRITDSDKNYIDKNLFMKLLAKIKFQLFKMMFGKKQRAALEKFKSVCELDKK